ncbi:MAG: FHA domain-containing protein [Myxococcaceae bacterium]|nr:FHA domain-containing protein [Myxococcaceae bacterium]
MPPPPSKNPPARARTGQAPAAAAPARRRTGVASAVKPAARLVCTAGPASGQEFPLSGDEVTIGRAADATVSVPDTSVSRKHALLRKTEDGWAVSDLGSGNGTIVNGEGISEEQPLAPDDVITLGDSEFQFVDQGAGNGARPAADALAPSPRRPPVRTARTGGGTPGRSRPVRTSRMGEDPAAAAKKRKRVFIIGGSALAVLMAVFVGYKAIAKKKEEELGRKRAAIVAQRKELTAAFQEAKNMTKEGRWVEAKERLEQLVAFDAEVNAFTEQEKKSIATYLERANVEIPNEQAIGEAKKAIADDQLGKASAALARVKNTITMERPLNELKELLETRLGEKVIDARKKLSASPRDLAVMEQVKAMAEDVMAARPEDRDAPDIKRQAEDNINRIKNPNLPPPVPEMPHLEVSARFRNGDLSGAMSLAQACAAKNAQCRALEGQMKDFDNKNKNLENLSSAEVRGLFNLDKRIAGGQSSDLSKQIKTRMATVFYKEASNAKTVRNWVEAIQKAQVVLEVDPGHPGATAIIQEGRNQAHDIYLRGYQLRETSPDEAARLFKEVIMMTPPDDTDHQKAKSRLEELQRR